MSCLVCAGVAERIQCHGAWAKRDCPAARDRYGIADALVLAMIEEGQIFDVSKTRIWLTIKRKQEAIPAIEIHEALVVP